jgi:hypothetical protein
MFTTNVLFVPDDEKTNVSLVHYMDFHNNSAFSTQYSFNNSSSNLKNFITETDERTATANSTHSRNPIK